MYCPNCATQATPGQRYCRSCGANLGVIVDAMDGKRGPIDFDTLKSDLRELGANLRAGLEEARQGFQQATKKTHRFVKPATPVSPGTPAPPAPPAPLKLAPLKVKQVRGGSTRRYSLQQAFLSIFSGGATAGTLYYFLHQAAASGLLGSIEQALAPKLDMPQLTGLVMVLQTLWVIGLIPVAKGFAHLINGIFFPVQPEPETKEVVVNKGQRVVYTAPPLLFSVDTDELSDKSGAETGRATPVEERPIINAEPPASIIEDETMRLGAREAKRETE